MVLFLMKYNVLYVCMQAKCLGGASGGAGWGPPHGALFTLTCTHAYMHVPSLQASFDMYFSCYCSLMPHQPVFAAVNVIDLS